jgi:hypothetical protein
MHWGIPSRVGTEALAPLGWSLGGFRVMLQSSPFDDGEVGGTRSIPALAGAHRTSPRTGELMVVSMGHPALPSRRQDEVGRFLADHDGRSVGVARRQVGHDRSVGNT